MVRFDLGEAFPCLQSLAAFSVTPSSGDTPQRPGESRSRVTGFLFGAPALRRVDLPGSAYAGGRHPPEVAGRYAFALLKNGCRAPDDFSCDAEIKTIFHEL